MQTATVDDVINVCNELWPLEWAESWDSVGLAVGHPRDEVRAILVALDPTDSVIDQCREGGYDFLFTHHPLLLRGVRSVRADSLKGGAITALITSGIAQFNAHTNADSAPNGVTDVIADQLGLTGKLPLQQTPGAPDGVGLGRVGRLTQACSLRELAVRLAEILPPTVQGVRIAGEEEATVETVAVLGGAGDSLFSEVEASGADVYITSDLRHHPASEARDRAHREQGKPYLLDTAHWASESLWLDIAAEQLRERLGKRFDVHIDICTERTDPWNGVVGQSS